MRKDFVDWVGSLTLTGHSNFKEESFKAMHSVEIEEECDSPLAKPTDQAQIQIQTLP